MDTLKDQVNADTALVRRGRYLSTTFLLDLGTASWLITVREGRIASVAKGPFVMPSWSFALRGSMEDWAKFCKHRPPPGSNDLMALIKRRAVRVEGDIQIFMTNLRYLKEVLGKLRASEGALA